LCILCGKAALAYDYKESEPKKVIINQVEYEMDGEPECPTEGCRGRMTDALDWEMVRRHHHEYPEIPEHGVVYDYDIEWVRGYVNE
jgi:hypothetical protein